MKKENFISLVLGVIGTLVFGIGMCMCLMPEWNAFNAGVAFSVIGAIVLLAMLYIRRKAKGKKGIKIDVKKLMKILLGLSGALVLGVGMCMVMVWNLIVQGIIVGIAGIAILLCLIPFTVGIKE